MSRRRRPATALTSIPAAAGAALAELASLQEERRFVFHRYMEAIAIYVAILGFAGAKYFEKDVKVEVQLFLLFFVLVANTLAWLGANEFRRLAYHALERENILADHLGMQRPYGLIWGYWLAITMGAAVELGALAELARISNLLAA